MTFDLNMLKELVISILVCRVGQARMTTSAKTLPCECVWGVGGTAKRPECVEQPGGVERTVAKLEGRRNGEL